MHRPSTEICIEFLSDNFETNNVSQAVFVYNQSYPTSCPKPYVPLTADTLPDIFARVEKAEIHFKTCGTLHTAINAVAITVAVLQTFCIFKTYLDYRYVMFRNEGASIERRCKILILILAILLRSQSYLSLSKIYVLFSIIILSLIVSLYIRYLSEKTPVLAICYIIATLVGMISGYYGMRDSNLTLSLLFICLIILQIVAVGIYFLNISEMISLSNVKLLLSMLAIKMLINFLLLINFSWCMYDFHFRKTHNSN